MPISIVSVTRVTAANSGTIPATTAGNTLLALYAGSNGAGSTGTCSTSGITLGGSPLVKQLEIDAPASASASCCAAYMAAGIAGGATAVAVSGTGLVAADAYLVVWELAGMGTAPFLDVSSTHNDGTGASTNWTSDGGSAPVTTVAAEFWAGIHAAGPNSGHSPANTLTPAGAWTNQAQFAWGAPGGDSIAGAQIVAATGSLRYNGTSVDFDFYTGLVIAIAPGSAAVLASPVIPAYPPGLISPQSFGLFDILQQVPVPDPSLQPYIDYGETVPGEPPAPPGLASPAAWLRPQHPPVPVPDPSSAIVFVSDSDSARADDAGSMAPGPPTFQGLLALTASSGGSIGVTEQPEVPDIVLQPPGMQSPAAWAAPFSAPDTADPSLQPYIDYGELGQIPAYPPGLISPSAWSLFDIPSRVPVPDPSYAPGPYQVSDSDSATAADGGEVIFPLDYGEVPVYQPVPPGLASPPAWLTPQTPLPDPSVTASATVSVSDSDTAIARDGKTLNNTPADNDFAAGTDAGEATTATLSDTDAGTAADGGEFAGVVKVSSDSATAADLEAVSHRDSDSATASEATSILALVPSSDAGHSADAGSITTSLPRSSDAAVATDGSHANPETIAIPVAPDTATAADGGEQIKVPVSSADTATAAETQATSATLSSSDNATAAEASNSPSGMPIIVPPPVSYIPESFSLTRCAMLGDPNRGGSLGTESAQLYGARSITLQLSPSVVANMADDIIIGEWNVLANAVITVTTGFVSFPALALLEGVTVSSSGVSPRDYYALPIEHMYAKNHPFIPVAARMSARDTLGRIRTLDFVFYKVQLDFLLGTAAYKNGLGCDWSGQVLFSATDEAGNTLPGTYPANLQVGRMISSPGQLTGAFGNLPFTGH